MNSLIKSILKKESIEILDSKIIMSSNLSSAFGCTCEKIELENGKILVIKAQKIENESHYLSIYYEGKSIQDMHKKFPDFFPKVYYLKNNFFIMDWIYHNNLKDENSEQDLAYKLSKMHSIKNLQFGYHYNTPIGGLEQPSKFDKSWINFFRNNRLLMIMNKINNTNPLPLEMNLGLEKIINNLEKFIPESNCASLIHGDLWSGNILYNNGKLAGLIDPSISFSNNELDLASLIFLNAVSPNFINEYKKYIKIENGFEERVGIYKLYYALLNAHLWSRSYIVETEKIIKFYNK